jgi:putative NADH-flavin reductase
MARIKVLGGTGFAGDAVVREAVKRGHTVTSYSRRPPAEPVEGAAYVTGSLLDPGLLAQTVQDADVVFETVSPRGDMVGKVEGLLDDLIRLADEAGVRLGVLGGASSLLVSEGGPRLFDTAETAPEILPEVQTGLDVLEALKAAPETLDWFYVSPAASFGAWVPAPVTGSYRVSDDVLLEDANGESVISGDDLALAVVDVCRALGCEPADVEDEFDRVGDLLVSLEERIREDLMPDPGLLRIADPLTHLLGSWSLERARDAGWAAARALWALRPLPDVARDFTERLDAVMGFAGRMLLTPLPD